MKKLCNVSVQQTRTQITISHLIKIKAKRNNSFVNIQYFIQETIVSKIEVIDQHLCKVQTHPTFSKQPSAEHKDEFI